MKTGLRGACPSCFVPIGWEKLSHEGIIHGRSGRKGGPYFTIRCSTCQTDLKAVGGQQRIYAFFEWGERRKHRASPGWKRVLRGLFGKPEEPRRIRQADPEHPESEPKTSPPTGRLRRHQYRLNVLGLSADVSLEELKLRYRSLVKECHPDLLRQKSAAEQCQAERRFVEITNAYQGLIKQR